MPKKTVAITIDQELWEMADKQLPVCRSKFIEDQIKKFIGLEDTDETRLHKEITKLREEKAKIDDEINIRETMLCDIKKKKAKEAEKEEELASVKETLERFKVARGFVSKQQLKDLSKHQNVDHDVLVKLCKGIDLKIC